MQNTISDFTDFSLIYYFLIHTEIRVQFLWNTSTVYEGNSVVPLTIQLQLTPAGATLLFNVTITLSVSSGNATGTVYG